MVDEENVMAIPLERVSLRRSPSGNVESVVVDMPNHIVEQIDFAHPYRIVLNQESGGDRDGH